jgi:hypothetical protein
MWIFTETGFISAVSKPEYPDVITVRARDKASLEALAAKANVEIKRSPNGDYPFRVFVGDSAFIEWFLDRGAELTYDNFKSRVSQTRGSKFAHALNKVWAAMLEVEDEDSREAIFDDDGNPLRHSDDVSPRAKRLVDAPSGVEDLSEEEQIAWAENQAEQIADEALHSLVTERDWDEEEK